LIYTRQAQRLLCVLKQQPNALLWTVSIYIGCKVVNKDIPLAVRGKYVPPNSGDNEGKTLYNGNQVYWLAW